MGYTAMLVFMSTALADILFNSVSSFSMMTPKERMAAFYTYRLYNGAFGHGHGCEIERPRGAIAVRSILWTGAGW